jgi:hypothetical protein
VDLVGPHHPDELHLGEDGGEELGERQVAVDQDVAEEADEVAKVAPHQLGPEDPVVGRARGEGPLEVAVVGRAAPERRALRRLVADDPLFRWSRIDGSVFPVKYSSGRRRCPEWRRASKYSSGWPATPLWARAWHTSVLPLRGVEHTR